MVWVEGGTQPFGAPAVGHVIVKLGTGVVVGLNVILKLMALLELVHDAWVMVGAALGCA
jgi:hypothetical protein